MAKRSTRNKLLYQAHKAILKIDGVLRHLQFIDDLADDRSPLITVSLPILVKSTLLLKDALTKFRGAL